MAQVTGGRCRISHVQNGHEYRSPQRTLSSGVMELFHFCKHGPCPFVGGSKSASGEAEKKRDVVVHVPGVEFTGLNETPEEKSPIVDPDGANRRIWFRGPPGRP